MDRLRSKLLSLDGRSYKAYKDLQGKTADFGAFELHIDHVQGDPFAAPSRLRVSMSSGRIGLPEHALEGEPRRRASRDFLARSFRSAARAERNIEIDAGAQTVLERSACLFLRDTVELRFRLELPGRGRRIMGHRAAELLCRVLPEIIDRSLLSIDPAALKRHCDVVEDQVALRKALPDHDLVAFLADGASLPRRSGIDDRPADDAVVLDAPESLRVRLPTPNSGEMTGMGIPRGVTLIVGGGFHGKSTLLRAIENGVYDHVPGDGREHVVTVADAVKIRAEDGRSVSSVDISPFIGELPGGRTTEAFSTDLASGSTSQAAALVEALEVGAEVLLLDEDTSATNFMIRDERMQALVSRDGEPITPFVDRIGELRDELGVSTILVMGGSGDYFDHADTVIRMDAYRPIDVTVLAREIAETHPTGRTEERSKPLTRPRPRRLSPSTIRPERRPGVPKVSVRGLDTLILGRTDIDLRAVEQLVDPSQLRAIGWLLARIARIPEDAIDPVAEIGRRLETVRDREWDALTGRPDGDIALPRLAEVMATLNRLRGVRFH